MPMVESDVARMEVLEGGFFFFFFLLTSKNGTVFCLRGRYMYSHWIHFSVWFRQWLQLITRMCTLGKYKSDKTIYFCDNSVEPRFSTPLYLTGRINWWLILNGMLKNILYFFVDLTNSIYAFLLGNVFRSMSFMYDTLLQKNSIQQFLNLFVIIAVTPH